jgi:hypothetical protein
MVRHTEARVTSAIRFFAVGLPIIILTVEASYVTCCVFAAGGRSGLKLNAQLELTHDAIGVVKVGGK